MTGGNAWPIVEPTRETGPNRDRPGNGKPVTHDNATTSQIAQIVELDGLTEHLGYLMRRA